MFPALRMNEQPSSWPPVAPSLPLPAPDRQGEAQASLTPAVSVLTEERFPHSLTRFSKPALLGPCILDKVQEKMQKRGRGLPQSSAGLPLRSPLSTQQARCEWADSPQLSFVLPEIPGSQAIISRGP